MNLQLVNHNGILQPADDETRALVDKLPKTFSVEVKQDKKRTLTQNNALHKYCERVAEALNDSGQDMRHFFKEDAEIPWNLELVKSHIWKPIQKLVIDKDSTTEATTTDYNKVYEVLHRHLAQKHGITVLWPTHEDLR